MAKHDGPIVITGMGAVSPFGLGVEAFWSALKQGERPIAALEQDAQPVPGLKVRGWQPADLLGKRGLQYLHPSAQFLLGASQLALQQADLADGKTNPDELGVTIGCNLVGLQAISDYDYTAIVEGPRYVSPMEAPNTLANAPASHLAIRLKARALNTTIASGQCAGLDALGYAAKAVREGRARQVIVGGVEELSPAVLWIYRNSKIVSGKHMENVGRPFDLESTGWLPSEGAAVAVLERKEDTLTRGARPLAELVGWSSAFAPSQTFEQRSRVLERAARQALDTAGLVPEDVDVVIAGASGLREQDQAEALALHNLLMNNPRASVTAIKGTLGETYGASGLFQALAAICMMNYGIIPPTTERKRPYPATLFFNGLLTEARVWPESRHGTTLLLTQDLFGSTSAVVLRGCQE
ncbi:MAG TPA: beta-ketoacyl synthase N-terminal-like domain-containing protein [Ktedonobacteraceae bacterium]|jgi:3-oxoacyl-[acyl-carrier-protein] synthase II|nr:beta-ketoacyl synthase N-terminal-like domain-containing protein [Ktedonobacteraceae bacterium]HLI71542.1 beta-ketoacyl synthase N-terminal-like domain-containing protein [Ktedonobacteraceae bacterium]